MWSNRLAFAALGLASVMAAAGGSYLATRQATQTAVALAPSATSDQRAPVPAVNSRAPERDIPPEPGQRQLTEPPTQVGRAAVGQQRPARSAGKPTSTDRQEARAERRAGRESPTLERTSSPGIAAQADTQTSSDRTEPAPFEAFPPTTSQSAEAGAAPETPAVAETVEVQLEELVVSADSVVGLVLESTISSESARVEDTVEARVGRDVRVGRRVAIPAGSQALGSVIAVDRGGKFKNRARLGVRFHTLLLSDGTRLPVTTETIYRYGDGPSDSSAKRIGGGAVAGAILGAILGGAKGAAVGATAGAGGGTAVVMAGERSAAVFVAGSEVTARILSPVSVAVDR